jgi:hypothetical protein
VHFPVEDSLNRSVRTADLEGVIPIMASRPYSFAFWDYQDLTLVLWRFTFHSLVHR